MPALSHEARAGRGARRPPRRVASASSATRHRGRGRSVRPVGRSTGRGSVGSRSVEHGRLGRPGPGADRARRLLPGRGVDEVVRVGRRPSSLRLGGLVLELADRLGAHCPAVGAAPRRSAATRRSRKMIVWPVTSSRKMTANSRMALIAGGQFQTTLSGVRKMNTTRMTSWNRKQPSPGPRSGSRSSPLYWIGPVGRWRRGGVGSTSGSTGGSTGGGVGSVTRRNDTVRCRSARRQAASRVGRQALDDHGARDRAAAPPGGRITFHDRDPPPTTTCSRASTRASTQIGQVSRQPEHGHAADLHAGDVARRLGRGERRLARAEAVAHRAIDVEPVRGEDDARGVARRIALADDQDRVRRVLGREAVGRAERGRVGQGRVAGEQLVVDAQRLERGDEPVTAGGVVRGQIDARGARRSWRKRTGGCAVRRCGGRYHRRPRLD